MSCDGHRISNPFSTRWVKPGAMPYLFPKGADIAKVVERLRQNEWRGAIIGPHGSGKSTLIAALMDELARRSISVRHVALHADERKPPSDLLVKFESRLLIIDGFEQLSWWTRKQMVSAMRKTHGGLVIVAHNERATCGIHAVFRTVSDLQTLQNIIENYLPPEANWIQSEELSMAFYAHQGNLRNALFALYDLFEMKRAAHSARSA